MVFYFKSNIVQPPAILYMGRDKHENEELIRWGWPEDVWFHVNNLSSAHVYLRLKPGQTIDDIPSDVLVDAAQLCKANSIQGNKVNNLEVVYTMWENLKKTPDMEPGQVAYHNEGAVRKIRLEKRVNEIVNRLNRTKTEEEHPDFRGQREARDVAARNDQKKMLRAKREQEKEAAKQRELEAEFRSYASLQKSENMRTNYDAGNESDDFM
ncbi:coiled-coil domain-containing protein 25-like [Drosophila miranda]|uniref:coiled-coil domain-containing protein 25 n=1 Tax=Drosophila miranda TaxID=7229 RepID=UPI0007E82EA4|nr:coiled-coil domain-containing protein 25 [Drosophila miranda]XP_033252699.1 coiled-coil domain-containing protein 25-like [Drosophila miranda]